MNWLCPDIPRRDIIRMLGIALLGAILAGLYGVLHDQISYTLSPEYFTRLKFLQFHYADLGFSHRVFASQIGFLSTWWIGGLAGWFLARMTVPAQPLKAALRRSLRGFALMISCSMAAGFLGNLMGINQQFADPLWSDVAREMGVEDSRSFIRVACIHNAGYAGAALGFLFAMVSLRRSSTSPEPGTGTDD